MNIQELLEKIKPHLTRQNLEKVALGVMVLSVLGVAVGSFGRQSSLTLDQGKIRYQGSVLRGKMNGRGTLTFDNGDQYTGNFKNGAFDGKGTFTSKRGWTYEGDFVSGLPEGKGKLTTESKVVYEGDFKQGIYQNAN